MKTTDIKNLMESKMFKKIFCALGVLVAVMIIFQAGVFVGFKKANFSYGLGDNYHRMFGDRDRGGFLGLGERSMMRGGDFSNAHGTIGKIVSVNIPLLIVAGQDGVEKNIMINEKTIIRQFRNEVKTTDLKAGDNIVVIGTPNASAQIEATLIRIMPSLNRSTASTSTPVR